MDFFFLLKKNCLRANPIYIHTTVNVDIFAQYIFSRISRRALDERKYDVSEKMNHYRSNRNTN